MGWWSISNNGGGISLQKTELYNGDGPADILGDAMDKVVKEYQNTWGRPPYKEEVVAAFNFVTNGLDLAEAKVEGE